MREILFRGKRMDNGEWAEGYLYEHEPALVGIVSENDVPEPSKWFIARTGFADWNMPRPVEFVEVYPSTVGQYTGLNDKNGKRIFEGDIVRTHYANTRNADFVEQVVFHNGRFSSLYELRGPGTGKMWSNLPDGVKHFPVDKQPYMEWCEIIGNIHDNPELLDGEDDKV